MTDADTETKTAFAIRVGVSKPRISQLVAKGLPCDSRGRVKICEALEWLDENLDPVQRAVQGKVNTGLAANDDEPENLTEAKRRHEIVKTERTAVALAKDHGALVDKAAIGRAVFAYARSHRDAWLAWSARTAPTLAAELAADGRAVAIALDRLVVEHLHELADLPLPEGLADG